MAEGHRDMADLGVKATVRVGPGGEPPWYFIGSDLVTALWCFAGAIVFTAFIAVTARKLGPSVWPALGIMLISFADPWHPQLVNDIQTVSTAEAKEMARRLAREEGVFAGASSGANVATAIRVAEQLGPGATVATLVLDSGLRYLSTDIYR